VKVAHPLMMLRAIAAAKKKNDWIDAGKIADCGAATSCRNATWHPAIRDRRRTLRYRHLLVRQMVHMKNRISGLLMETGVSHNKRRLHKVGYFRELLASNEEVNESIRPLQGSRDTVVRLQKTECALGSSLQRDPRLAERIQRLKTIPGVRAITALTWALEMGEVLVSPRSEKPSVRNIAADIAGQPRHPFRHFDMGIMAMIGRNAAVAEIGRRHHELEGVIAFAAWRGVHSALLSTSRAKIAAFMEWAWDYFGNVRAVQILNRSVEGRVNWNDSPNPPTPNLEESTPTSAK
jgi:hypothetical protein